jgi:hypothetical protein
LLRLPGWRLFGSILWLDARHLSGGSCGAPSSVLAGREKPTIHTLAEESDYLLDVADLTRLGALRFRLLPPTSTVHNSTEDHLV